MQNTSLRLVLRKICIILVGATILYFGFCLVIKAGIGTGAWDAMLLSLADTTGVTVGTLSIVLSTMCIAGQILLEGRHFDPVQLCQLILVFFGGTILDFFNDVLLYHLVLHSYSVRLLVAVCSYILIALGVVIIMESRLIRNPLEGLCQIIADRRGMPMGKLRQWLDIGFVACSLLLSLLAHSPLHIREGTVLCMMVFGPTLDFLRSPVRHVIARIA